MAERHEMTILIEAGKGDVRAARGLVSRAIKKALGVKKWYTRPHNVSYSPGYSGPDVDGTMEPRYYLEVSYDEGNRVMAEAKRLADEEGWNQVPAGIYG